jgi:hypothetical protein
MRLKVKVIDSDLIRAFGKATVIMTVHQAKTYGNRIRVLEEIPDDINFESENKSVWIPPESKVVLKPNEAKQVPYPNHSDSLFPQIKGT